MNIGLFWKGKRNLKKRKERKGERIGIRQREGVLTLFLFSESLYDLDGAKSIAI